jgi:hypothetical protein
MKEIAYIHATKKYGGYARHGCMTLFMFETANTLSHNVQIEWLIDEYDDEGSVVKHYAIERWHVLCGSEPLYQLSGPALDEVAKVVEEMVEELTNNGFHIIDTGSYWYNLKLERDWDALYRANPSARFMVYQDIDQEDAPATAGQGSGEQETGGGGSAGVLTGGGGAAGVLMRLLLVGGGIFLLWFVLNFLGLV